MVVRQHVASRNDADGEEINHPTFPR